MYGSLGDVNLQNRYLSQPTVLVNKIIFAFVEYKQMTHLITYFM